MSQNLALMWVTETEQIVSLKCSCHIEIWKLLVVTAGQVKSGVPVVCPEHNVPHDFSSCEMFKDMAIAFANQFPSEREFGTFCI